MAIQLNYVSEAGITVPTAYAHIITFRGNKTYVQCQVDIYRDKASKEAKLKPLEIRQVRFELLNGATLTQIYDALKLIAPFVGSIDC